MKSMKWKKPSQQLIEFFNDVVPEDEGVAKKKMFGYPCAFKKGNMFMGLHQEYMFLRLSKNDRETSLELDQASQFEPMPGRIMREYVVVPSWMLKMRARAHQQIALICVKSTTETEEKEKESQPLRLRRCALGNGFFERYQKVLNIYRR